MRWFRPEALVALLWSAAVAAQPQLALPLACNPGEDCWISNHVDLDPGPGARDHACGTLTYEAHNGTDFAVRDLEAMRAGTPVLAAAAGVVRNMRDGMPDTNVRDTGKEAVARRECGNGMAIDHGDGWETQYCHLRRGSVKVRRGERVAAGQPVGLVGMSGLAEYPHLHFTVRHQGKVVDPFGGKTGEGACQPAGAPLWSPDVAAKLPYAPGALYNYGITTEVPRQEEVREGRHRQSTLAPDAPRLIAWFEAYGVTPGMTWSARVVNPAGTVILRRSGSFEKAQARVFRYFGGNRRAAAWTPGTYAAEFIVGSTSRHMTFEVR